MFGSEVLGLRAGESTDRQQLAGPGYWEDGWWVDATPDPLAPSADRPDVLPDDLETWEPGRSLATVVSSADRSRLSGYHLIRLVQAQAKLVAHHQAGLYQSIAQVAALVDDADAAAAEVAAALHLTRAASEAELELAVDLSRLPQVGQVLARGDIDLRRARVIIDNTRGLTPDVANQIVARVMPSAATLTTGQLRARISRLRMEQDTDRAHNEYRAALEDRRIVVGAQPRRHRQPLRPQPPTRKSDGHPPPPQPTRPQCQNSRRRPHRRPGPRRRLLRPSHWNAPDRPIR